MADSKCYRDIDYKECCCICENQVRVIDNRSQDCFAYGCTAFLKQEQVVFCYGFEHGRCEYFEEIE